MPRRLAGFDAAVNGHEQSSSAHPGMMPLRILIVCAVKLYRDSLAMVLGERHGMTVVGAVDPHDALTNIAH